MGVSYGHERHFEGDRASGSKSNYLPRSGQLGRRFRSSRAGDCVHPPALNGRGRHICYVALPVGFVGVGCRGRLTAPIGRLPSRPAER